MKRREIREILEAYGSIGPRERYVLYQMSEIVEFPFGRMLAETASHDALRACAAVSLMVLCFGDDGYDALETVAEGTGFGAWCARKVLAKPKIWEIQTVDEREPELVLHTNEWAAQTAGRAEEARNDAH